MPHRWYNASLVTAAASLLIAARHLLVVAPQPLPPDYRAAAYGSIFIAFVFGCVASMVWRACHMAGSSSGGRTGESAVGDIAGDAQLAKVSQCCCTE